MKKTIRTITKVEMSYKGANLYYGTVEDGTVIDLKLFGKELCAWDLEAGRMPLFVSNYILDQGIIVEKTQF